MLPASLWLCPLTWWDLVVSQNEAIDTQELRGHIPNLWVKKG